MWTENTFWGPLAICFQGYPTGCKKDKNKMSSQLGKGNTALLQPHFISLYHVRKNRKGKKSLIVQGRGFQRHRLEMLQPGKVLGGRGGESFIPAYELCNTAITNYHKLVGLKQHTFILSQFWRLDIWNQGIGRAMLPPKTLGESPSLLLDSGGCGQSFMFLGLWKHQCTLCLHHHMAFFPVSPLCLQISLSL